jgi:hypothetical protein
VEILGAEFDQLPTYYRNGRAYVLGTLGQRYRVRVSNPTARRVEAVVSVDGLDAIDGRNASYTDKRGYIIAPYSEVTLDGFRTSLHDVATFRFSSVRDSYAGRKGNDRNVGVIGVALFPERERPLVRRYPPRPYESDRERASADEAPAKKSAPSGSGFGGESRSEGDSAAPRAATPRSDRPGLGTEFGERRASHVEVTRFERQSPSRPASILEVRYNDRPGLLALGIPVDDYDYPPRYGQCDLCVRESADPFPSRRFAEPPP